MIFKRQNEQDGRVVDYVDLGRNAALTPYELRQSKQELVDTDGCFTVHCLLRALPIISSPPPDHDSKQATGMVGLENLGATCYLNALLQASSDDIRCMTYDARKQLATEMAHAEM